MATATRRRRRSNTQPYGDVQALSDEQQHIINEIIRIGRKRGMSDAAIETALAVGYTESRWTNPEGGDRDSGGWRQERRMYYDDPTNLPASINRFYDEYKHDADKKAPLGVRAQQVQQSGTPHVWDTLEPLAQRLLREFGDGATSAGQGQPSISVPTLKTKQVTEIDEEAYESAQRRFQVGQLLSKPKAGLFAADLSPKEGSGLLADFDPSDSSALFKSGVLPTTAPALGEFTKTKKVGVPSSIKVPGSSDTSGNAAGGASSLAGLQIKPDGWKGSHIAIKPAQAIAEAMGIATSSEKRPTVNTASGNMSDHYEGNKIAYANDYDTPGIDTSVGDKLARRIAKKYGMTYERNQWNEKIVEIDGRRYRAQLGYGSGIDHGDHVHFGLKRVD